MPSSRDEAFTAYVAARRSHLFRTAYLLCGDPHRAEDIVQNALARLYVAWPRAARADSVDAYVRRSVVNSHLDETRRPWRRERSVPDGQLDGQVAGQVAGQVNSQVNSRVPSGLSFEDADALWRALRDLGPGQRRVVVLRHFWGLSVEETAADLGISPGTVKSQTSDALARLRAVLVSDPSQPGGRR